MGTFNRAKLMTTVRTSGANLKAVTFKELLNLMTSIEFTTLIKVNIPGGISSSTVSGKEVTKILERHSFRLEGTSPYVFAEVVRDEAPTGFTMDTKVVFATAGGFGFDTREGEINGKTLEAFGSFKGGSFGRDLGLFGLEAGTTLFENPITGGKIRNTINMFTSRLHSIIKLMA